MGNCLPSNRGSDPGSVVSSSGEGGVSEPAVLVANQQLLRDVVALRLRTKVVPRRRGIPPVDVDVDAASGTGSAASSVSNSNSLHTEDAIEEALSGPIGGLSLPPTDCVLQSLQTASLIKKGHGEPPAHSGAVTTSSLTVTIEGASRTPLSPGMVTSTTDSASSLLTRGSARKHLEAAAHHQASSMTTSSSLCSCEAQPARNKVSILLCPQTSFGLHEPSPRASSLGALSAQQPDTTAQGAPSGIARRRNRRSHTNVSGADVFGCALASSPTVHNGNHDETDLLSLHPLHTTYDPSNNNGTGGGAGGGGGSFIAFLSASLGTTAAAHEVQSQRSSSYIRYLSSDADTRDGSSDSDDSVDEDEPRYGDARAAPTHPHRCDRNHAAPCSSSTGTSHHLSQSPGSREVTALVSPNPLLKPSSRISTGSSSRSDATLLTSLLFTTHYLNGEGALDSGVDSGAGGVAAGTGTGIMNPFLPPSPPPVPAVWGDGTIAMCVEDDEVTGMSYVFPTRPAHEHGSKRQCSHHRSLRRVHRGSEAGPADTESRSLNGLTWEALLEQPMVLPSF